MKDPHVVGKFVEGKLGRVWSFKIRSGMVLIERTSRRQRDKAPKIHINTGHSGVKCFPLGPACRKIGLITGEPMSVVIEAFWKVAEDCDASRMSRVCKGEK